MSVAVLLAGLAGACALLAAWEAIAAAEQERVLQSARRWCAPVLDVLRSGREPTSPERRRLVALGTLSLLGAGWLLAGAVGRARARRRPRRGRRARWCARAGAAARTAVAAGAPAIARALADALAGGHSVRGALAAAASDGAIAGPAGEEMRRVAAGLALGERTEDVLRALARARRRGPLDTLVAAVLLQRDAGGDLAALLRDLAAALEERGRVVADARSATAQARFTALLVTGLPVAGLALGEIVQPGFVFALVSAPITAVMVLARARAAGDRVRLRRADRAGGGAAVSAAVLLAVAAAISAAAAIAEALSTARGVSNSSRSTRSDRHTRPRMGRLAGMTVLLARLARRAGMRAAPRDLDARIAAAGAPLGLSAGDVVALKGAGAVVRAAGRVHPPRPAARPARARRAARRAGGGLRRARARFSGAAPARASGGSPRSSPTCSTCCASPSAPGCRSAARSARWGGGCAACSPPSSPRRPCACSSERRATTSCASCVARCPGTGVATLAAAIARSDRHGAPLAPALSALAAEARAEQSRRLRDGAARAAPKIQLVVALVLVPAVMLLVGAVLVQGFSDAG